MNEALREIEKELEQLQPSPPLAGISTRIQKAIEDSEKLVPFAAAGDSGPRGHAGSGSPTRPVARLGWLRWVAPSAAAAILTVSSLALIEHLFRAPSGPTVQTPAPVPAISPPVSAGYLPVSAHNHLESARDDGGLTIENGAPYRRVRYQFRDSYIWEHPEDGTRIRVRVPREKVLLVPAIID